MNEGIVCKSTCLSIYLFGVEFSNFSLLISPTEVHIFASKKTGIKYFRPLLDKVKAEGIKFRLHTLNRADGYKGSVTSIIDKAKSFGEKLAVLTKEIKAVCKGNFVEAWVEGIGAAAETLAQVDAKTGLATLFSVKDVDEQNDLKMASLITAKLMKHVFMPKMEAVIDKNAKTTNSQMAEAVDTVIETGGGKLKKVLTLSDSMQPDQIEPLFSTVAQSGNTYSPGFGVESNKTQLSFDIIHATIGSRYNGYGAVATRTFLFNPNEEIRIAYKLLQDTYEECLGKIKPGVPISSVIAAAKSFIGKSEQAHMSEFLLNKFGHGIGLEMKESVRLTATNKTTFKAGMVFYMVLTFKDVPNRRKSKKQGAAMLDKFSLSIGETILVTKEPDKNFQWHITCLTLNKGRTYKKIAYEFADEDGEEDNVDETYKIPEPLLPTKRNRRAPTQTVMVIDDEKSRRQKQHELMLKKAKQRVGGFEQEEEKVIDKESALRKMRAYKDLSEYPRNGRKDQIHVDMDREVVLIPINNTIIPFHISTVKNVSINRFENDTANMRINFYTPEMAMGKDAPPAMVTMCTAVKKSVFVKQLVFKCAEGRNFQTQTRKIKELQKRNRANLRQLREEKDLIEQKSIILSTRPARLQDVCMRPPFTGRGRSQGTLEAHKNSFRFKSARLGQRLDINYTNIKHSIFQPCKQSVVVLIHFRLLHPIMIGKKKQRDIQFYTEVIDQSIRLNSRRKTYDPDELDEEQNERQLRKRLNELFRNFVRKSEQIRLKHEKLQLQFEIPFKQIAFKGSVGGSMRDLIPTTSALVNLTEQPSFVVSLDEVDHVHLERVTFRSSSFDMAIVFKDWDRPVERITMIDVGKSLDTVRKWLTEINQTFTSGSNNIAWKNILKMVKDDSFFWKEKYADGEEKPVGWNFLDAPAAAEDGNEDVGGTSDEFVPESESEDDDNEDEWGEMTEESEEDEDEEDEDEDDWEEVARQEDEQTERKRRRKDHRDRQNTKFNARKRRR